MSSVQLWTVPASFSARQPRTAVVFLCLAGFRASCRATAELRLNMSESFWSASWREKMEQLIWWRWHKRMVSTEQRSWKMKYQHLKIYAWLWRKLLHNRWRHKVIRSSLSKIKERTCTLTNTHNESVLLGYFSVPPAVFSPHVFLFVAMAPQMKICLIIISGTIYTYICFVRPRERHSWSIN